MVSRIGGDSAGAPTCHRQLPITYFAHKTAAVCDDGMATLGVLAACDIAAKRRRAAGLDGAHHLQLCVAHVAAIGITPTRAEVAEDVRDLQSGTLHERPATSPGPPWGVVAIVDPARSQRGVRSASDGGTLRKS